MPTNQKPRTNQYHQTQRWPVQSTSINIKALSLLHNYAGVLLNRGQFDFTDYFFYIYWFSKIHLQWIQARLILLYIFLQVLGQIVLSAITGTAILTPNLSVMSVWFIWRSGTCRFHLCVPDFHKSCTDLARMIGYQDSNHKNDHQGRYQDHNHDNVHHGIHPIQMQWIDAKTVTYLHNIIPLDEYIYRGPKKSDTISQQSPKFHNHFSFLTSVKFVARLMTTSHGPLGLV